MATIRPVSVVTSASEMPPARIRASFVPALVIVWKRAMMPVTVPSSPSSGAMEPSEAMRPIRFSSRGRSVIMASFSSFSAEA